MKNIVIKSVIIGFLSAIVVACGVAAIGVNDKWDERAGAGGSIGKVGF
jgi:hypothetical protein